MYWPGVVADKTMPKQSQRDRRFSWLYQYPFQVSFIAFKVFILLDTMHDKSINLLYSMPYKLCYYDRIWTTTTSIFYL